MNVEKFICSNSSPLQAVVQVLVNTIRRIDSPTADILMKKDIRIDMFYYSDAISIGPLKLELLKEGYDKPYISFNVIEYFNVDTFAYIDQAILCMAEKYMTIYGPIV